MNKIRKEHGEEAIVNLNEKRVIQRIDLSSPVLGDIIGNGGFPEGRIAEIYGKESSGKSLIATLIGADYQKAGKFVTYIDLEHSFSKDFAEKLGLMTDADHFQLLEPMTGEEAFDMVHTMSETGQVGLIIFDSLAGVLSIAEDNAGFDEMQMAANAKLIAKGIRKTLSSLAKNKCSIIFINQTRQKMNQYVSGDQTTGGESVKFFSSIRLSVNRKENIAGADEDDIIGIRTKVKCVKNKTATPFKTAEIDIYFKDKYGMDIESQYIDLAIKFNVIQKAGAWFSFNEIRLGQGKENASKFLKENPEVFERVKNMVNDELKRKE